jgi:hypothetical protein
MDQTQVTLKNKCFLLMRQSLLIHMRSLLQAGNKDRPPDRQTGFANKQAGRQRGQAPSSNKDRPPERQTGFTNKRYKRYKRYNIYFRH